jgi:hypothetical protein
MVKNELLTKEEIAIELSPPPDEPLSIRSVERYVNLAQVVPAVKGSGRGNQAKFRRADVEKIKAAYKTAAELRENQSMALTTTKHDRNMDVARVVEALLVPSEAQARALTYIALQQKFTLTLAEAAELCSGLSEDFLAGEVRAGRLKGFKRRGWVIKRTDLDAYIKKL